MDANLLLASTNSDVNSAELAKAQRLVNIAMGQLVQVTPLQMLSFNATAETKNPVVFDIFEQAIQSKEAFEVIGRASEGFKAIIKFSNGKITVMNRKAQMKAVEVRYKDPKGIQFFVIYSSGKIRMQGENYNQMLGRLIDLVGSVFNIKFNNTTGTFKTNVKIMESFWKAGEYEPEIRPYAIRKFKSPKYSFMYFYLTKTVQISGALDIEKAYEHAVQFLRNIPENYKVYANSIAPEAPAKKAPPRKGTTCPKNRRPSPYSYQGKCKEDCYVQPNPQGQPCCYLKKRFKADEVRKAYKNAMVNIPNSVRELLGPSPSGPSPVRRNSPSARTSPKSNLSSVPAPSASPSVRTGPSCSCSHPSPAKSSCSCSSGSSSRNGPSPPNTSYNAKGQFKIGTLQCSRYSLPALKAIAEKYGIDASKIRTKKAVCELLEMKFPPKSKSPFRANFSLNNANYALVIKNGKKLINRRVPIRSPTTGRRGAAGPRSGLRVCETIAKKVLEKYARALGMTPAGTKAEICKQLFEGKKSPVPRNSSSSPNNNWLAKELLKSASPVRKNSPKPKTPSPVRKNSPKPNLYTSPGGRFRVGKKLCEQITPKSKLVEIAKKFGVPHTGTVKQICQKLKDLQL